MEIPHDWVINGLVLTSMMLQLVLLFGGALRYRCSSKILALVVWLAYMSADSVATSALGTMLHSCCTSPTPPILYALWAPLLLLHLGGPDTITAYSMPDNELWIRHGLNMAFQISVAAYVIWVSAWDRLGKGESYLFAAVIIIFLTGSSKYAERTFALRLASYSQIASSVYTKDFDNVNQNLLECGQPDFLRKSHKLFSLFKLKFVNISFTEKFLRRLKGIFCDARLMPEEVFKIVEIELKFFYDIFFSKSGGTAFTIRGSIIRVAENCLLAEAWFLIYSGLQEIECRHGQRIVTYVLISVAVVVAVLQLCRIIFSDWSMLWLIDQGGKLRITVMPVLVKVRKVFVGEEYWQNKIRQHSLLDTYDTLSPCLWRIALSDHMPHIIGEWFINAAAAWEIKEIPVDNDFKSFVFEKLKANCRAEEDSESCIKRVLHNFDMVVDETKCVWTDDPTEAITLLGIGLDHFILAWHTATAICEKEEKNATLSKEFRFSGILSRYCVYLLVSCPTILPLNLQSAIVEYNNAYRVLSFCKVNTKFGQKAPIAGITGETLARKLLKEQPTQRWQKLSDIWCGMLIYFAYFNKPTMHAERLARGGEFLTHVWMLLALMGGGEKSDSPIVMRHSVW